MALVPITRLVARPTGDRVLRWVLAVAPWAQALGHNPLTARAESPALQVQATGSKNTDPALKASLGALSRGNQHLVKPTKP